MLLHVVVFWVMIVLLVLGFGLVVGCVWFDLWGTLSLCLYLFVLCFTLVLVFGLRDCWFVLNWWFMIWCCSMGGWGLGG